MKSSDLNHIFKLSIPEKILLVEALWDNIANNKKDFDLSEETLQIVSERFEEYKRNPSIAISWDDIKKELGKK